MPEMMMPRRTGNRVRDRITGTLDAAIREADRVGYISAEEGDRRVDELLKKIDQQAAAGQIKP